jgi:hypothetical protein
LIQADNSLPHGEEFIVKRVHLFLVFGAILIISFQNCGRSQLKTLSSSSISQGASPGETEPTQTCSSNVLACERDNGFGQQICTQISPQSISLGICVLSSCKTGFALVNGSCVSYSCQPGTHVSCDLANGTGTRTCSNVGQYGSCLNPICDPGFHLNSSNVCVADVVTPPPPPPKPPEPPPEPAPLPEPPKTCTFNGKTLQYGEQVKAYNLSAVYGTDICANHQQVRTCYGDNNLSGSYPFASCKEAPPVVCVFGGKTVKYGDSIAAFSTGAAPGADICANHKEMRKCIGDNVLSGSYIYESCIDDENPPPQPLACPSGMKTYNLGGLMCAYYCELYANTLPASYKCSNGIYIFISACKSGPAYKGGIYMKSIPTKNASYSCNTSNIYP